VLSISWELASALKESKARFDSAGVKLIAVGVGTPDKARILAERVFLLSFWCNISEVPVLKVLFNFIVF
jgi:hypothetical protein